MLYVNTPLRREEEIIKSHVEQVNHLTYQELERKFKEKGTQIVRLLNIEESYKQRKLENKITQIEDVPSVRELGPNKQRKQSTMCGNLFLCLYFIFLNEALKVPIYLGLPLT